jgi:hypothetical protein
MVSTITFVSSVREEVSFALIFFDLTELFLPEEINVVSCDRLVRP